MNEDLNELDFAPEVYNTVNSTNILSINVKDVSFSEIEPFTEVPFFKTPSILPHPVVVYKDGKYRVIDGFDKIQALPATLESVKCVEYVLFDNSDESIAIEKAAIRTRPAGGTASFGELIRILAALVALLLNNLTSVKIIIGHGGSRQGKDFEDGELLTKLLSERLGKTVNSIKNILFYAKYLSTDVQEEFAINKVSRKFFVATQPKKTKLIDSLKGKSDEEITIEVSNQVLIWWKEYNVPKEITSAPQTNSDQARGIGDTEAVAMQKNIGDDAPAPEAKPLAEKDEATSVDGNHNGVASPPEAESAAEEETQGGSDSPSTETKTKEEPDAHRSDPDHIKEGTGKDISNIKVPSEDRDSENDVKTETAPTPPINFDKGGAQGYSKDIYENIKEIAGSLIAASDEKQADQTLYKIIQRAMAELTRLLEQFSEANIAQSDITLAEKMNGDLPAGMQR
jgi:hypothetical protein